MPIIISKNGKDTWRVERTCFKEEEELQKYIFENPDCILIKNISKPADDTRVAGQADAISR